MGLADLVQSSSAAPATPASAAPKSAPVQGAPVPASYAPAPVPTMADTSAPKQTGLAGLVAGSSHAQPLGEHQALSVKAAIDADQAQKDSVQANSPSAITRDTARDLGKRAVETAAAPARYVSDNAERLFPSTAQTVKDLGVDPLSLKADPRKALSDVVANLKTTTETQTQNYRDMFDEPTAAGKAGAALRTAKGFADIAFSPITTLFTAANDIPVLGSIAKIVSLPFNVTGDAGKDIGTQAVRDLPISQAAKDKIAPGIEDIFALAAQIVAGGKILESTTEALTKKYGARDAATIEAKAREMADAHKGHDEGVKAQGESVSHPGIESLVASSSAADGNTVYSGAKGDGATFHTPDLETAQRHARMAGATEVTKADIAGKNILEVPPEDMQKAVEDPANREKYDGVKFQVEGEPHPTYALFDKQAPIETEESTKPQNTPNVNEPMASQRVPIEKVQSYLDENTASRINEKYPKLEKMVSDLKDGKEMPPIPVHEGEDGQYHLNKDGAHRLTAYRLAGRTDVPIRVEPKTDLSSFAKQELENTPIGEKAPSALAQNTRTRAIEAGIEADFGELPEYAKMDMADEAAKADSLVNTDMERALRIAEMKETPGAGDPRAASVYKALELKADADGNAELALRLAKSPLATEMSVKGQEIKALDRGGRDTTVKAIKDIQEERQKAAEKRNGKSAKKETDSTIKEAKKAKDSVKVTKQTWSEFIEQIKCNY